MKDYIKERVTIIDNVTYSQVVGGDTNYGEQFSYTLFFTNNNNKHGDILVGKKLYTNISDIDASNAVLQHENISINLTRNKKSHELELTHVATNQHQVLFDVATTSGVEITINTNYKSNLSSPKILNPTTSDELLQYIDIGFVENNNKRISIKKKSSVSDADIDTYFNHEIVRELKIRYTIEGKYYYVSIFVTFINTDITPVSLDIIPEQLDMTIGDVCKLSYVTTPNILSEQYNVVFSSSDPAIRIENNYAYAIAPIETSDIIHATINVPNVENVTDTIPVTINRPSFDDCQINISPKNLVANVANGTAYFYASIYPQDMISGDITWMNNKNLSMTYFDAHNSTMNFSYNSLGDNESVSIYYKFTDTNDNEHLSPTTTFTKGNFVPVDVANIEITQISSGEITNATNATVSVKYDSSNNYFTATFELTSADSNNLPNTDLDIQTMYFNYNIVSETTSGNNKKILTYRFIVKNTVTQICNETIVVSPVHASTSQSIIINTAISQTQISATSIKAFVADKNELTINEDNQLMLTLTCVPANINNISNLEITKNDNNSCFYNVTIPNNCVSDTTNNTSTFTIPATLIDNPTARTVKFYAKLDGSIKKTITVNVVNNIIEPTGIDFNVINNTRDVYANIDYIYNYTFVPVGAEEYTVDFPNNSNYTINTSNNTIHFKNTGNYGVDYSLANDISSTSEQFTVSALKPTFSTTMFYLNYNNYEINTSSLNYTFTNLTSDQLNDVASRMRFKSNNQSIFKIENNKIVAGDSISSALNTTTNIVYCVIVDDGTEIANTKTFIPIRVANANIVPTDISLSWMDNDNLLSVGKTTNMLCVNYVPNNANTNCNVTVTSSDSSKISITKQGDVNNGVQLYKITQTSNVTSVRDITIYVKLNNSTITKSITAKLCPTVNTIEWTQLKEFYIKYLEQDSFYEDKTITVTKINNVAISQNNCADISFDVDSKRNTIIHVDNNYSTTIKCDANYSNLDSNYTNPNMNNPLNVTVTINKFKTFTQSISMKAHVYSIVLTKTSEMLKINQSFNLKNIITFVPDYATNKDITVENENHLIGCNFTGADNIYKFTRKNDNETCVGGSYSILTIKSVDNVSLKKTFRCTLYTILDNINIPTQKPFMNVPTKLSYTINCKDNMSDSNYTNSLPYFQTFNITSSNTNKVTCNADTNDVLKLTYVITATSTDETQCSCNYTYYSPGVTGNNVSFNVTAKQMQFDDDVTYYILYKDENNGTSTITGKLTYTNITNYDVETNNEKYYINDVECSNVTGKLNNFVIKHIIDDDATNTLTIKTTKYDNTSYTLCSAQLYPYEITGIKNETISDSVINNMITGSNIYLTLNKQHDIKNYIKTVFYDGEDEYTTQVFDKYYSDEDGLYINKNSEPVMYNDVYVREYYASTRCRIQIASTVQTGFDFDNIYKYIDVPVIKCVFAYIPQTQYAPAVEPDLPPQPPTPGPDPITLYGKIKLYIPEVIGDYTDTDDLYMNIYMNDGQILSINLKELYNAKNNITSQNVFNNIFNGTLSFNSGDVYQFTNNTTTYIIDDGGRNGVIGHYSIIEFGTEEYVTDYSNIQKITLTREVTDIENVDDAELVNDVMLLVEYRIVDSYWTEF